MATEPFTGLPFTAAGQLQTDLEQNALLALMGPSLSGYVTHNVTAGEGTAGEITLSYIENWMAFLTVTDDDTELTGPADLIMPANFPMRLVANVTAQTITLKKAGQTGVALAAGSIGLFVSGATDVVAFSGSGGGATALSALTDVDLAGLADGDMILWDATAGKWVPIAPSAGATTLAALTDVDLTGLADGDLLAWDATAGLWLPLAGGGGGSPGGSTTQVQFNNAGAFGGDSTFTWDNTAKRLTAPVIDFAKATDIARAATTSIGAATGNFVHLTGTTTVTSFGTGTAGMIRYIRFAGAGTLTHDATSLILPGAANITTAANDTCVAISEGSSNWRVVSYERANGTALAATTASAITGFTSGVDTASPNATVPVVYLNATNGATNVDVSIKPKGNGALVIHPSSVSINKRGQHAVDLNRLNYASTYVASGTYSFTAGGSMASSDFSIAMGYGNSASSTYAIAMGYQSGASGNTSVSIGATCAASGIAAVALGKGGNADADYSLAMGGDRPKVRGLVGAAAFGFWNYQRQRMFLGMYLATYDATPTVAKSNSSPASTTNQLVLPNESVFVVEAMVSARHNSSGDCAAWKITVMIKRHTNAASTTIVGTPSKTLLGADAGAAAWDVAVSADTTNGALKFTCTGDASRTTEWTIDTYSVQAVFS